MIVVCVAVGLSLCMAPNFNNKCIKSLHTATALVSEFAAAEKTFYLKGRRLCKVMNIINK